MRLFRLVIVLSTLIYFKVVAQTTITIDEAINLAMKNNVELQKFEAKVKIAETEVNESSRIPNPSFSYSREDLSHDGVKINEWAAMGSLPINFLWERWNDIDSREYLWKAQKLFLQNHKISLISKIQTSYTALNNHVKEYNSIIKVQDQLNSLIESANQRFSKGDISEYELQRMMVELNKVNSLIADSELKTEELSNTLKLLIGIKSGSTLLTTSPKHFEEVNIDESQLLKLAHNNRNDLKAHELLLESEKNNLSLNKARLIPEINIGAGYKKQSDNFSGSVLEIEFDIPIFKRNQTRIDKSEIDYSVLKKELLFLKEQISVEVKTAIKKYALQKSLFNKISNQDFTNLLKSASLSYEYGEISLVEFLDGINAYIDGVSMYNQIKTNYLTSYFELQRAIGNTITNIEEN